VGFTVEITDMCAVPSFEYKGLCVGGSSTVGCANDIYKNMQTAAFLQLSSSWAEVRVEIV
jgi:hypothetical protein